MIRPIVIATIIAGTLDILFAIGLTLLSGREPAAMLRFVASGPFPGATGSGAWGAAAGLAVHFALMSVMATAFFLAARRLPNQSRAPVRWGVAYGLLTYVAMNLVVVPLRFPTAFPPTAMSVATQLFAHVVLVGLPISLIAAQAGRRRF